MNLVMIAQGFCQPALVFEARHRLANGRVSLSKLRRSAGRERLGAAHRFAHFAPTGSLPDMLFSTQVEGKHSRFEAMVRLAETSG
jgi:hypothetical protein